MSQMRTIRTITVEDQKFGASQKVVIVMQEMDSIYAPDVEGFTGLHAGTVAALSLSAPMHLVEFREYAQVRENLYKFAGVSLPGLCHWECHQISSWPDQFSLVICALSFFILYRWEVVPIA